MSFDIIFTFSVFLTYHLILYLYIPFSIFKAIGNHSFHKYLMLHFTWYFVSSWFEKVIFSFWYSYFSYFTSYDVLFISLIVLPEYEELISFFLFNKNRKRVFVLCDSLRKQQIDSANLYRPLFFSCACSQ